MSLPIVPLPRDTIEIAGTTVEYRSLSRAEVYKYPAFEGQPEKAEIFTLACGLGLPEAEIVAWREATDATTVGKVVDAIVLISGLATAKQIAKANAIGLIEPVAEEDEDPSP